MMGINVEAFYYVKSLKKEKLSLIKTTSKNMWTWVQYIMPKIILKKTSAS